MGEQQHERDIEDTVHDRIEQRQPKQVKAEVAAEERIGDAEGPAIEEANGVVPKPGEADRNEERQQDRQRPAEKDRSLEFGEHGVDRGAGCFAPAFHDPQGPTQVEPEREHERHEGRCEKPETQIEDVPEHRAVAESAHPEQVDDTLG